MNKNLLRQNAISEAVSGHVYFPEEKERICMFYDVGNEPRSKHLYFGSAYKCRTCPEVGCSICVVKIKPMTFMCKACIKHRLLCEKLKIMVPKM